MQSHYKFVIKILCMYLGSSSQELRYTNLPIISDAECKADPWVGPWILPDMICARSGFNNDRDSAAVIYLIC